MGHHHHHDHHDHHPGFHGHHSPNPFGQAAFQNGPFDTPASICTNTTLVIYCDTIKIHDYIIISPELLPCCIMALILGLTFAHKILNMRTKNYLFYAMTFAMIGVMMTAAGIADCLSYAFLSKYKILEYYFAILDVGLTSSIGYTFFILGLLDAGCLSEKNRFTWGLFGSGVFVIFSAWTYTFLKTWKYGQLILYMGIVGIGCGTWVVIQIMLVIKDGDWESAKWLLWAGLNGGIGFFTLLSTKLRLWLCEHVGCHFSTNFTWFLVTDTCLYFIYRYYKSRVEFQPRPRYVPIPMGRTNNIELGLATHFYNQGH